MPTPFAHAVAGLAIGAAMRPRGRTPARWWLAGALCAVVPDLDVIAFRFGVPYESMLGHRGISHSLFVAAAFAAVLVGAGFRGSEAATRGRAFVYVLLATASHGLLDAFTDGGLGPALLAPFTGARYFFAWTPIRVAPLGVARLLSGEGARVLASEAVWVLLPSILLAAAAEAFRHRPLPTR
jgi:inner membrane protein